MTLTATGVGRPAQSEYPRYYDRYVDRVPDGDIIDILEAQIAESRAFFGAYTPEEARRRPAPGEWNVTEIVGHLSDVERVFAYRALRIARSDMTMWSEFDPPAYVEHGAFADRDLAGVIEEFAAGRAATVALLRGLDETAWARRMPETFSCRSVRAYAYIIAGHELHHIADLRSTTD